MNSGSPSTPSSPYTLSNERYKANVNRTKTRKWVEAKKIDYGGDDWGADNDFEEEDAAGSGSANEPTPPIPQPQQHPLRTDRFAGLRAIGDGSGSSSPRSGSAGSVRSLRPSERIAMERHGSGGVQQRNVTAPPALHVNTGVQSQRPVQPVAEPQESLPTAQKSPYPPRESSMTQQDKPDLTIDPGVQHPPRTSSRSASPGFRSSPAAAGSTTSPRLVRPSEIYKRMEEEKDKERQSPDSVRRPSLDTLGSGDGSDAASGQRRPSFGRNDGDASRTLQPLASVAEGKSEYGFDGLTINAGAPPAQQPKVSGDTVTETPKYIEIRQDPAASLSSEPAPPPTLQYPPQLSDDRPPAQTPPPKQYSTSPKLPEFARMSGFGSDFFSGRGGFLGGSGSASPKQPKAPAEATHMPATGSNLGPGSTTGVTRTAADATRHSARDEEKTAAQPQDSQSAALSNSQPPPEPSHPKPFRPSLPGAWVSETPSSTAEMPTPFSDQGDRAVNPQLLSLGENPDHDFMKPAPLRTPTPRDRESFSKMADEDRVSNKSGRSSPTKPGPLRTTASLYSNVEQSGRTPTQKEYSQAEVHQASDLAPTAPAPLQPRKSAGELPQQDRPQLVARTDTMLTEASTAPQESDVLRDEIIRSLSPARSSSHLDAQADILEARQSAYLSDVYGDYWDGGDKGEDEPQRSDGHVEALATVRESHSPYATSASPTAVEPEPVKPGKGRERFSWEASSASLVPSPKKHPLPALPKDEPSPTLGAQPLGSPADSGRMSPMISLPVVDFGGNDSEVTSVEETTSRDAKASSALGHGTHGRSATPPPLTVDHDTITATSLFSPDSAHVNVESPTTPTASTNPYFRSPDPEPIRTDSPTDVPLPRSPTTPTQLTASHTEGGDADLTPRTSTGDAAAAAAQNTMTLKQIMGLPTSPERVYKLYEARAEFATTPTGLAGWLAQMLSMREHANAGPSFKYAPAGDDVPLLANQSNRARRSQHASSSAAAEGDGGPAGGMANRRSSLTLGSSGGGGGGGSVRIAAGAQAQLGNLMHRPAGAKGKELLQSAGKMGKGLLSKGKNKLRERAESKKG